MSFYNCEHDLHSTQSTEIFWTNGVGSFWFQIFAQAIVYHLEPTWKPMKAWRAICSFLPSYSQKFKTNISVPIAPLFFKEFGNCHVYYFTYQPKLFSKIKIDNSGESKNLLYILSNDILQVFSSWGITQYKDIKCFTLAYDFSK